MIICIITIRKISWMQYVMNDSNWSSRIFILPMMVCCLMTMVHPDRERRPILTGRFMIYERYDIKSLYPEDVERLKQALDVMRKQCGDSNMRIKGGEVRPAGKVSR